MLNKIERGTFLTYLEEEKKLAKKGEACEFEVAPLTDQDKLEWDVRLVRVSDDFRSADPATHARAILAANMDMFIQVVKKIRNGDVILETPEEIANFAKEWMDLDQRSEINNYARSGKGQTDHLDGLRLKNA